MHTLRTSEMLWKDVLGTAILVSWTSNDRHEMEKVLYGMHSGFVHTKNGVFAIQMQLTLP